MAANTDATDACYETGRHPPHYPVPAIHNDRLIRPLLMGYWSLYWYRRGLPKLEEYINHSHRATG